MTIGAMGIQWWVWTGKFNVMRTGTPAGNKQKPLQGKNETLHS
jgi:hypothetical protein